jgi:hypothetical protein
VLYIYISHHIFLYLYCSCSRSPPPRRSSPASRPEPRGSPKYERAESPMNGRYDRYDTIKLVFCFEVFVWYFLYISLYFDYFTFHVADLPHLVIGRGRGHDPKAAE